ncbi:MAG: glycoside hydrolase family 3 N-terminal domain-containing protein [Planctomycetota bacterium]
MSDLRPRIRRLIVPVFDLREGQDLAAAWEQAAAQVRAGYGGLILFGGSLPELPERLAALKALGPHGPPLIAADVERGVGQQVLGARDWPPAMALGASDDPALAEAAGYALGSDARAAGIDWIFGPVLDLADEPRNPIVGARALGADPERVAALGAAFVRGIQRAGALACGKHFPGHGGTVDDSHATLPRVTYDRARLEERDLAPFRAAVAADVASFMTAHVAYPAFGVEGPATRSRALVSGLLRDAWGFAGLVVTDALMMAGVQAEGGEARAACAALEAGCDVLLYPTDPEATVEAVAAWAAEDPARVARIDDAVGRLEAARARLGQAPAPSELAELDVARAALTVPLAPLAPLSRGERARALVLDDDALPGFAHELLACLAEAGVELELATVQPESDAAALARARALDATLLVVGCRVRAWKGRPGLAEPLQALVRGCPGAQVVGLCGPGPLAALLPGEARVLLAYGDEPAQQRAAAAALLGAPTPGRLPVPWRPA